MTFTRIATSELRERVRERLVADRGAAGARRRRRSRPRADEVVDAARRRARSKRSASAASDWPARSPTSTRPRSRPRTASARRCSTDSARSATRAEPFVVNVSDLARAGARRPVRAPLLSDRGGAAFTLPQAQQIARIAMFNPMAKIYPVGRADGSTAAMRCRLARAVRDELE